MKLNKVLEQHIAVFGASGSGKTVLLSSFYGAAQEAEFLKKSLYKVSADDIGQGSRLHKNYLGMRDSAERPEPTRFAATSYSFTIKIEAGSAKAARSKPFDSLRLVWHDYPGEWFEQDVSGPEEAQRRVDTFRALLVSDVAVLLVDGQRLLDNAGEEEKYLKSLLHDFRVGLENLKEGVLRDGKSLNEFPRIWIMALSKADLLPDFDVFKFRDLLILNAADDLDELRKTIMGFVQSSAALSVGEDFVLLSSAEFGANKIEVSKRIGLNLMLPISAILPLERYVRWVKAKKIAGKVADAMLEQAGPLAIALLTKMKLPGPIGALVGTALAVLLTKFYREVEEAAEVSGDKLKRLYHDALDRQDNVQAVLADFKLELERGEEEGILLRSQI